jgi:hypothetical protein
MNVTRALAPPTHFVADFSLDYNVFSRQKHLAPELIHDCHHAVLADALIK